jgi:hypothetical protein
VPEGVHPVGYDARLVEKLGVLQVFEAGFESPVRDLDNHMQERQRDILANNRCHLQHMLRRRWQPVDARC